MPTGVYSIYENLHDQCIGIVGLAEEKGLLTPRGIDHSLYWRSISGDMR